MRLRLTLIAAAVLALAAVPAMAGASIAFTKYTKAGGPNQQIWLADDDGANERKVGAATGMEPMISPNGRWIAYEMIANTKTWDTVLAFVDVQTGAVTKADWACNGPVWSPDSSRVACAPISQDAKGNLLGGGLWLVTPTLQATEIVAPKGNSVLGYSFSPDSTWVAYGRQAFPGTIGGGKLRATTIDGTQTLKLGVGANPVWGPEQVAYMRTHLDRHGRTHVLRSEIWMIDVLGGIDTAEQLTSYASKGFVEGPMPTAWTPDGASIIGTVTGEDKIDPVRINARTGKVRPIGPANALPTSVSADGTQVLVVANQLGGGPEQLYAVPVNGTASSLLIKNVDFASATQSWQP
jgi:Tol biopolymer transport system component